MWGLKKRLNSRRERRDLEIGVYLGRRRGSDVTSHVYWDISPAFLNPDFGTKAGKIRPFCEADLQGVRLPRPARCDSAGAQCGEPALARGQAASPNVDPAARASLSGSQRPAAARRARRTREKTRPPAKLKTRSRGTLRPAGPRTEPLASSSSDVSRILSEASLRCVKRKVNLGGGGKKTVKGVAEACRCLPCPPPHQEPAARVPGAPGTPSEAGTSRRRALGDARRGGGLRAARMGNALDGKSCRTSCCRLPFGKMALFLPTMSRGGVRVRWGRRHPSKPPAAAAGHGSVFLFLAEQVWAIYK